MEVHMSTVVIFLVVHGDTMCQGAVLVKDLAAKEPSALSLDTYYKQYYLCLAAASATIRWIEADKGVIITSHSLVNLELIEPFHSNLLGTSNKKNSLFHMLKTTTTVGGLLRANLLQPLKDIETINARLDCLYFNVIFLY
ncbi:DNA mismatch repair protein MSH4-like protein [Drosera capensis]